MYLPSSRLNSRDHELNRGEPGKDYRDLNQSRDDSLSYLSGARRYH